jgi:hypothetical protein
MQAYKSLIYNTQTGQMPAFHQFQSGQFTELAHTLEILSAKIGHFHHQFDSNDEWKAFQLRCESAQIYFVLS